jgi:phosphatidylinositol 4-kinase type 2
MNVNTDASDFLRSHPWPGRSIADTFDDSTHRATNCNKRFLGAVKVICGRTGAEGYDDEADMEYDRALYDASEGDHNRPFYCLGRCRKVSGRSSRSEDLPYYWRPPC